MLIIAGQNTYKQEIQWIPLYFLLQASASVRVTQICEISLQSIWRKQIFILPSCYLFSYQLAHQWRQRGTAVHHSNIQVCPIFCEAHNGVRINRVGHQACCHLITLCSSKLRNQLSRCLNDLQRIDHYPDAF